MPLFFTAAVLSAAGAGPSTAVADEPVAEAGASSTSVTVRKGDRGPAVRRVQRRLRPFTRGSVVHPGGRSGGGAPAGGAPAEDEGSVRIPRVLRRIAECESGGDPRAVSPGGRYRGKFQFSRETWEAYGGRGSDPAEASESHQDRIALRLYRARGTAPWPTCGKQ